MRGRPSGVRRLILMAGCRNELNDTRSIAKVNNSLARLFAVIYVVGRGNRDGVFAPGQGGAATTFGHSPSPRARASFFSYARYMRNSTNESAACSDMRLSNIRYDMRGTFFVTGKLRQASAKACNQVYAMSSCAEREFSRRVKFRDSIAPILRILLASRVIEAIVSGPSILVLPPPSIFNLRGRAKTYKTLVTT